MYQNISKYVYNPQYLKSAVECSKSFASRHSWLLGSCLRRQRGSSLHFETELCSCSSRGRRAQCMNVEWGTGPCSHSLQGISLPQPKWHNNAGACRKRCIVLGVICVPALVCCRALIYLFAPKVVNAVCWQGNRLKNVRSTNGGACRGWMQCWDGYFETVAWKDANCL